MSICRRKTGYWLVKFKDSVTGQWKQRQFKSKADAEAFDASARYAVAKDEPLSLRDAIGAYVQGRTLCESSVLSFVRLVEPQGCASHLADAYVHTLNRQDLESVRSKLRAEGMKTTTINRYTGMIKTVLKWCAAEDLIEVNPWAKYPFLPGGKTEHRSGRMDDLRAVYPFLPAWMQWAVRTAVALCLRPGISELFSLTWDAFDWRTRTAAIYMPKTSREKTVFLPDWYIEDAQARCAADTAAGRTLVCRSGRDRAVRNRDVYSRPWWAACERAGVDIPFYALRHIAASEMLAAGADLAAVAAQLGHRDIATTAAFYTHAVARAQKAAAAALPAITKNRGGNW